MNSRYSENFIFFQRLYIIYVPTCIGETESFRKGFLPAFMRPCINPISYKYKNKAVLTSTHNVCFEQKYEKY